MESVGGTLLAGDGASVQTGIPIASVTASPVVAVQTVLGSAGVVAVGGNLKARNGDLANFNPGPTVAYMVAIVAGAVFPGDGGGGHFYWDPACVLADDGGTIIDPTAGLGVGRWIRIYDSGTVHASWFGCDSTQTDNSIALANAFTAVTTNTSAVVVVGGGTLRLPPGVIKHSQRWALDDAREVTIEGCGMYMDNAGARGTTLQLTAVDGPVAVSALSTHGLAITDLCIAPVAGFGGVCLVYGHSLTNGADTINVTIERVGIQGSFNTPADPVANTIGIWFAQTIGATVRDCWFINCRYGLLGVARQGYTPFAPTAIPNWEGPQGECDYSADVGIYDCQFGGAPIYNPHFTWTIDKPSVEGPSTTPWAGGYFLDGDSQFLSICLTVTGGVFGDGDSATWCNLYTPVCARFESCMFASGVKAIVFNGGYTPNITSCYFAGGIPVDFATTTYCPTFGGGNRGLVVLHPENGGLDGSNTAASFGNLPEFTACPPTQLNDLRGVMVGAGGFQIGPNTDPTLGGYSTVNATPAWSVSPVPDGAIASLIMNVGPTAGITPRQTTLSATLEDPNMPAGIFLAAYPIDTSTQAIVTLLNKSGAPYTPTAALRVSAENRPLPAMGMHAPAKTPDAGMDAALARWNTRKRLPRRMDAARSGMLGSHR